MKINEILHEGPLDFIKKYGAKVASGIAGAASAVAANRSARELSSNADQSTATEKAYLKSRADLMWKSFNRILTTYRAAHGGVDPTNFKDFVVNFANQYIRAESNSPDILTLSNAINGAKDSQDIYNYLYSRWAESQSAPPPATPSPATPPPATPQPTTPTAGAGAFGQMAGQLNAMAPPETSSTGGTTRQTTTGQRHTANPNNPNKPGLPIRPMNKKV